MATATTPILVDNIRRRNIKNDLLKVSIIILSLITIIPIIFIIGKIVVNGISQINFNFFN